MNENHDGSNGSVQNGHAKWPREVLFHLKWPQLVPTLTAGLEEEQDTVELTPNQLSCDAWGGASAGGLGDIWRLFSPSLCGVITISWSMLLGACRIWCVRVLGNM